MQRLALAGVTPIFSNSSVFLASVNFLIASALSQYFRPPSPQPCRATRGRSRCR